MNHKTETLNRGFSFIPKEIVRGASVKIGTKLGKAFERNLYRAIGRHDAAVRIVAAGRNAVVKLSPGLDTTRFLVDQGGAECEADSAWPGAKVLLQADDLGIEPQVARRIARGQYDGAKRPGSFDGSNQERRQHAGWRFYPFAVRKVFQLEGVTHVDDALAVVAGGRVGRADNQGRRRR